MRTQLFSVALSLLMLSAPSAKANPVSCSVAFNLEANKQVAATWALALERYQFLRAQVFWDDAAVNYGRLCLKLGQLDQEISKLEPQKIVGLDERVLDIQNSYRSVFWAYCSNEKDKTLGRIPTVDDVLTTLGQLEAAARNLFAGIKCDPTK